MKKYEKVSMEFVILSADDIILASGELIPTVLDDGDVAYDANYLID